MSASKLLSRIPLLAAILLLNACSSDFSVAGNFEKTGQPIYGKMAITEYKELLSRKAAPFETGTLEIAFADGNVICKGDTDVTEFPSAYTVIGKKRASTLTCDDGRTIKIDATQTTETGGFGRGIDSKGNVIRLYYDLSSAVARARLENQTLGTMVK